jgi:hypothetical protein
MLEFFTSTILDKSLSGARICIDVTGFMRPHMIYLVNYLRVLGVLRFDVIYTEPGYYSGHDRTRLAMWQKGYLHLRAIRLQPPRY